MTCLCKGQGPLGKDFPETEYICMMRERCLRFTLYKYHGLEGTDSGGYVDIIRYYPDQFPNCNDFQFTHLMKRRRQKKVKSWKKK